MKVSFGILILFLFGCGSNTSTNIVNEDPKNLDSLIIMREKIYLADTANMAYRKLYIDALLKRGNQSYKEHNYSKLLTDAARAFRLDSANLETRLLYADALTNKMDRSFDDIAAAQRHYKMITEKMPTNVRALVGLASTYTQQTNFEEAIKILDSALKIDKKYRDAYVMKGTIYRLMGRLDLAKSSYETAIQQDKEFYEAYVMLGALYQAEKNEICLQYFQSAVALKPKDPEILFSLAYAEQVFEYPDKAMITYKKMVGLNNNVYQAQALNQIGVIKQYNFNQLDSAIYYYNSATQSDSTLVEAWHNLGLCYEEKKQLSQAMRSYGKALHFNPQYEPSRKRADKLKYAR
jgi:tetratricopeptide (TPR) repeat protein